jgi:hypothetical protein
MALHWYSSVETKPRKQGAGIKKMPVLSSETSTGPNKFYNYRYYIHKLAAVSYLQTEKQTNSLACSPQANYTDRATAACGRS